MLCSPCNVMQCYAAHATLCNVMQPMQCYAMLCSPCNPMTVAQRTTDVLPTYTTHAHADVNPHDPCRPMQPMRGGNSNVHAGWCWMMLDGVGQREETRPEASCRHGPDGGIQAHRPRRGPGEKIGAGGPAPSGGGSGKFPLKGMAQVVTTRRRYINTIAGANAVCNPPFVCATTV